jgi:hypothetical protein
MSVRDTDLPLASNFMRGFSLLEVEFARMFASRDGREQQSDRAMSANARHFK